MPIFRQMSQLKTKSWLSLSINIFLLTIFKCNLLFKHIFLQLSVKYRSKLTFFLRVKSIKRIEGSSYRNLTDSISSFLPISFLHIFIYYRNKAHPRPAQKRFFLLSQTRPPFLRQTLILNRICFVFYWVG